MPTKPCGGNNLKRPYVVILNQWQKRHLNISGIFSKLPITIRARNLNDRQNRRKEKKFLGVVVLEYW